MLGSEARPNKRHCAPGESVTEYSLSLVSRNHWVERLLGATLSDRLTSLSLVSRNDRAEDHCRHEVVTEAPAASPRADCAFPPRECVCSALLYASATLRRCTGPALLPDLCVTLRSLPKLRGRPSERAVLAAVVTDVTAGLTPTASPTRHCSFAAARVNTLAVGLLSLRRPGPTGTTPLRASAAGGALHA